MVLFRQMSIMFSSISKEMLLRSTLTERHWPENYQAPVRISVPNLLYIIQSLGSSDKESQKLGSDETDVSRKVRKQKSPRTY